MSKAKNGDVVKVHYTGTLDDGTEFDSSREREPLEFTIGERQLLPGFEDVVIGMAVGESSKVNIPAGEGYGTKQENLIAKIPRDQLPKEIEPKIGLKLQTQTPEGQPFLVTIVELDDKEVTIDANHELAGFDLNFEIELVEIVS